MSPGGDTTEQYLISIVGQDQGATQTINAVADALAGATDQAAALGQASQSIADQMAAAGATAQEIFDATGQSIDTATASTQALDQSVVSLTDHYNAAAIAMQNAAANVPDLNNVSGDDSGDDGSGGGINPRALTTAGRLVGGSAGRGLRAVGQGARLADMLPDDSASLVELGSAALVAAPAVAGVAVALSSFNQSLQQDKDVLSGAIAGQQAYYQAIAQGSTTDQVTQKLQQLNQQRAAEAQQLSSIQGEEASAFQQSQQAFGDLGARLLDTQTPVASLRGEAEKLQSQVQDDTTSIDTLTQGLQNNAFAANDAANAEQQFHDQRLKDANEAEGMTTQQRQDRVRAINDTLADIQHAQQGASPDVANSFNPEIEDLQQEKTDLLSYASTLADVIARQNEADQLNISYAQDAIQADQMTAAQRKQKIADDNTAIAVDEKLINSGELSATATKQVSDQMTQMSGEATILGTVIQSTADKTAELAAQQKALTDENTNYLDTLKQEGTIRDQITADTQAMADARTAEQAKEADAVSSYQAQISDILAKGATQQQQIVQSNQDAVAKIERDSGQALNLDIGNRDAEKYAQDQVNEQNQLADQSASYDKSETQLTQSLTDQENAAKTSEQKQLTQLQTSLAAQEQTENQKLQQDQVNLINTTNAELAIAQNSSGNIVTVHENMWTAMYQTALHYAPAIAALLAGQAVPTITGGSPGSYSTLPGVTGTQTGISDAAYTAGAVLGDFINIGRDVLGAF